MSSGRRTPSLAFDAILTAGRATSAAMGLQVRDLAADPFADRFGHPLDERPYRMVVFGGFNGQHVPLYWVAGADHAVLGSVNALRKAIDVHGGRCFYCGETGELTVDHVLPKVRGGTDALDNLVACCRGCNGRKSCMAIACFDPNAAARWAAAQKAHHQRQLDRLALLPVGGRPG